MPIYARLSGIAFARNHLKAHLIHCLDRADRRSAVIMRSIFREKDTCCPSLRRMTTG